MLRLRKEREEKEERGDLYESGTAAFRLQKRSR